MKVLQAWQYTTQTEQSFDAVCQVAVRSGLDALALKALDGTSWMGEIEDHPDALRGPEQVADQAARARRAGLRLYVWTNPLATVDLDRQAALTAEAALACDGAFLDVEPYSGFWGANRPPGLAALFVERLRRRAPNAWLALQPDPREAHLAEIRVDEWLPAVNAFAGQHYWSDFFITPTRALATAELVRARSLGERFHLPVLPTLPGNAPADTFPDDALPTFPGFVVWRLGSTPSAMLARLGGVSILTKPTTPANCSEQEARIAALVTGFAHLADVVATDTVNRGLDLLRAEIAPGKRVSKEAFLAALDVLDDVPAMAQAIREQFLGPRPHEAVRRTPQRLLRDTITGNVAEGAHPSVRALSGAPMPRPGTR